MCHLLASSVVSSMRVATSSAGVCVGLFSEAAARRAGREEPARERGPPGEVRRVGRQVMYLTRTGTFQVSDE